MEQKQSLYTKIIARVAAYIPLLHLGICLAYRVSHPREMDPSISLRAVRPEILGGTVEVLLFSLPSILLGALFIWGLWQLVFKSVREKRYCYLVMAIACLIIICILYPWMYRLETDNLQVYIQTVREKADYWQTIYIGWIYSAALLVLPTPVVIPFLQLFLFVLTVFSLYERAAKKYGKKALFIWLICVTPEIAMVAMNPYRNAINSILYVAIIGNYVLDILLEQKRNTKQLVILAVFVAWMAIFRTEGIFLLPITFMMYLAVYKISWKKTLAYALLCLSVMGLLMLPQKLGEYKYIGKDYQIINYMEPLQQVLRAENANLTYDKADEDLAVIGMFANVDRLRNEGVLAYWKRNYNQGRNNVQSGRSIEQQKLFLNAANRILVHNIGIVVKGRMWAFLSANGYPKGIVPPNIDGDLDFVWERLAASQKAYEELLADTKPKVLASGKNDALGEAFEDFNIGMLSGGDTHVILVAFRILVLLMSVLGIAMLCKKGTTGQKWCIMFVYAMLFLELCMLIVGAPQGKNAYYYPLLYSTFVSGILLLLHTTSKNIAVEKTASDE